MRAAARDGAGAGADSGAEAPTGMSCRPCPVNSGTSFTGCANCCRFARSDCPLIGSNTSTFACRLFALHDVSARKLLCGEHFAPCAFHDHSVASCAARPAFQRRNRKSPLTLPTATGAHGRTDNGSAKTSHQAHQLRANPSGNRGQAASHPQAQVRQLQRRLGAYWLSTNAHSSDPKKPRGANHVPVAAPIEGGAVGPSSVASSGVAAPTAVDASQAATAAAVHRVAADKDSGERLAATPEVQSTSMRNPTASSAAHSVTIHLPLLAFNVSRQRQYAPSAPRGHRRPLSVGFCSVHPVFAGTPSCKGSPT